MKKLLPFLLAIVLVLSACGTPAVANAATPVFPETPVLTKTPVPAETATPIPPPVDPYAIISSDKVDFWFPLPDKQEYEWGISENFGPEYTWSVEFGNPQDYVRIIVRCGNIKLKSSQTGSFEDMLITCKSDVKTSGKDYVPADDFIATSYSIGGLLIQMTNAVLINKLMTDSPQSMLFRVSQIIRIKPSETHQSSSGSYAVILPDSSEFWFQLPNKTNWIWNKPIEYINLASKSRQTFASWDVEFGNQNVEVGCWTEWENFNKPVQTGSFEDLLKTCKKELAYYDKVAGNIEYINRNPPTASYTNGGLLIKLTDPEFVESLYNNPSQSIFFETLVPFDVTPIYK